MTEALGFRYAAGTFGLILLAYNLFFGFYSGVFKEMFTCDCVDADALKEPLLEKPENKDNTLRKSEMADLTTPVEGEEKSPPKDTESKEKI
jgi:hypothetical protein